MSYSRVYTVGLLSLTLVLFGAGCSMRTQVTTTSDTATPAPTESTTTEDTMASQPSVHSGSYLVSPKDSVVEWYGHRRVGNSHTGVVSLKSGSITVSETGRLTGGEFVVDMTTIASYEKNERLDAHLKSDDFFATETYSEARFVVTSVVLGSGGDYTVVGNMTIKGITKEISFTATMTSGMDGALRGVATITLDRSAFDIRYGSESFFDNLGDKLIENEMELRLNLIATK